MSPMIESLQDNFSRQPEAPGGEFVHQVRAQAMKEFLDTGLPGPRDEYWKYTRLRIIEKRLFGLPEENAVGGSDIGIENLDAIRIVFVDGLYAPALSDESVFAENGIRLLADALHDDPGLAGGLLPQPDPATHQFAALNRAFLGQGVVIELAAGQVPDRPLYLLFYSQNTGRDTASHPRYQHQIETAGGELSSKRGAEANGPACHQRPRAVSPSKVAHHASAPRPIVRAATLNRRHRHAALYRRTRSHDIEPALDVAELPDLLRHHRLERSPRRHHPRVGGHIGDGVVAGKKLSVFEAGVEDANDPEGLIDETFDRVRHLLRSLVHEMTCLPDWVVK